MIRKRLLMIPALAVLLSSCSLAPDFMKPDTDVPATFAEDTEGQWKEGAATLAATPRGQWWKIFNDETLDKLQDEALSQNPNLQAIAARVTQARETARIAGASFFPSIDGTMDATRQKPNAVARGMAAGSDLKIENSVHAGLGLAYELDLFGSVLNNSRAAKSDAEAQAAQYESAKLAMQADVAQLYFTLRGLDADIALLQDALKIREDSLAILNKRLEVGAITELDTASAVVDLQTTKSVLQDVMRQRQQGEHALALALGIPPAHFKLVEKPFSAVVPAVPAGLPSALLERRPDIAAAEQNLMAANARIGVARAAFFPSISLTGNGGFQSDTLGDLFKWSSRSWSLGPVVSLPVFHGASVIAGNNRAAAAYDEAVALYRLQVLSAFRDVEDALSLRKALTLQAESQSVAEKAAKRASDLANMRYESGDIGYLEAITARKSALDVERMGVQLQAGQMLAAVQFIRALGGGWDGGINSLMQQDVPAGLAPAKVSP